MTDRIQSLIDAGRLAREQVDDAEVAGLWVNAQEAFSDGHAAGASASGRLLRAYDAGRIAALAIVRAHDLRVRAMNHHETAIAVAAVLGGDKLEDALDDLDRFRKLRHHLEYGWDRRASEADVAKVLSIVHHILKEGARRVVERRPALAGQIAPPS
ncbi:MAG: hypothetical protein ACJ8GN_12905 [Longimicrobiaceae bacterium]